MKTVARWRVVAAAVCVAASTGTACTRRLAREDLFGPERQSQLHGAHGVEVVGFLRRDGVRVDWPGLVFLDGQDRFVFSSGGRLGDFPSDGERGTLIVTADSVETLITRNEAAASGAFLFGSIALAGFTVLTALFVAAFRNF